MKKIVVLIICLIFMVGCGKEESVITYKTISSNEAYEIMNTREDIVIIDVRNESEYASGHVKNAVNIPVDDIESNISKIVSDKSKTILVYCKSGSRSKIASEKLIDLGYKNVNNFGGINNWQYEIVSN